jgi:hypothetical protein
MSALLDELVEHAEKLTPEDKLKVREALLRFAAGKKSTWRGKWIN